MRVCNSLWYNYIDTGYYDIRISIDGHVFITWYLYTEMDNCCESNFFPKCKTNYAQHTNIKVDRTTIVFQFNDSRLLQQVNYNY